MRKNKKSDKEKQRNSRLREKKDYEKERNKK